MAKLKKVSKTFKQCCILIMIKHIFAYCNSIDFGSLMKTKAEND